MRFMMLMIPDVYQKPVPPGFQPPLDAIEEMGRYNEALQKAGVLLALDGMAPPEAGARVTFAAGKGKGHVSDIAYSAGKEVVGGYWIIEVTSRDEALEWARKIPAGAGDVVEVRKLAGPEDFA